MQILGWLGELGELDELGGLAGLAGLAALAGLVALAELAGLLVMQISSCYANFFLLCKFLLVKDSGPSHRRSQTTPSLPSPRSVSSFPASLPRCHPPASLAYRQ